VSCTTLPAAPAVVEQTRLWGQPVWTQQPVQLQMQRQQRSRAKGQSTQQQWLAWLTQAVLTGCRL
jgi:hypothetical protein